MTSTPSDLARLVSLIEAAREEALGLGPVAREIALQLERTARAARNAGADDGLPDQGLRPEELNTGNDQ